jgi:peptidoglycan/xylan/chitin deacetylase (PgdA/CDA1 family)
MRPLVLAYHRVAEPESDPFGLCVSPRLFTEHIEVIEALGGFVPLDEMAVESNDVVLTFDDGYTDCADLVAPLLRSEGIPAIFFICSGKLLDPSPYWWDVLAALVMGVSGKGSTTVSVASAEFLLGGSMRDSRHALMAIHARLLPLHLLRIEEELLSLREQTEPFSSVALALPAPISEEELTLLGDSELFEIGSHSINHAFLPTLEPEALAQEISGSRTALEKRLGKTVSSFSYPYGAHDTSVVAAVRDAGYQRAFSIEGALPPNNPLTIARQLVPPLPAAEFKELFLSWTYP